MSVQNPTRAINKQDLSDFYTAILPYLGGGSVTITPALQSGVKIADYSINGVEGAIYVPDYANLNNQEF